MTDSDQSSTSNPGLILKAAREELSFTVDSVAHELHLRASVVKAMEDEDYDTFSSNVFLKGYFRSYCRLVGLHEERMVELLEKQLSKRQQAIDESALTLKKAQQSKSRKKALVVFSLVGLIVCLGFYLFFLFTPGQEIQGQLESRDKTEEMATGLSEQLPNSDEASPDKDAAPIETTITLGENKRDKIVSTAKMTETNLPRHAEIQAPKKLEIVEPIQHVDVNQAEKEVSPAIHVENELARLAISVSFSGDCWFKLTDGTGKNVFGALKKAGDSLSYTGIQPFTIILGDATKAEIISKGKVVNLKPFTAKNGRAVITLNHG